MIHPEEYEGAISGIRFLCGVASNGRQYTFAEITVDERTDRDAIDVSFFVPDGSDPRDEKHLMVILGASPVNEAMDAWERRTTYWLPNYPLSVQMQPIDSHVSTEVSGCSNVMRVAVPRGPCIVNCCWSHIVKNNKIFVPTENENLSSWRVDVALMQGEVEAHGIKCKTSLSRTFRFDLASAHGDACFLPADNATLIRRHAPSLPYHNLWVPLSKRAPDSRVYHTIGGAIIIDRTAKRLINVYEVMLAAVPVVCGCFIRNCFSFPNSYVTLTVTERATRTFPAIFEDSSDGSNSVTLKLNDVETYRIDLDAREQYSGVNWVTLAAIGIN